MVNLEVKSDVYHWSGFHYFLTIWSDWPWYLTQKRKFYEIDEQFAKSLCDVCVTTEQIRPGCISVRKSVRTAMLPFQVNMDARGARTYSRRRWSRTRWEFVDRDRYPLSMITRVHSRKTRSYFLGITWWVRVLGRRPWAEILTLTYKTRGAESCKTKHNPIYNPFSDVYQLAKHPSWKDDIWHLIHGLSCPKQWRRVELRNSLTWCKCK